MNQRYDAILIGSGQAANPLAFELSKKGWKVLLIEKKHVGGTCINEGCTPTKTMIASAELLKCQSSSGTQINADLRAIVDRKNKVVARFRNYLEESLEGDRNITLIKGHAFFSGNREVTVLGESGNEYTYTADYIFINTGASPSIPSIKGINGVPYLTSTTILDLDTIPDHLVIIGGGAVAVEFAQMFRRFGSRVTLLLRSAFVLSREDDDVSIEIENILGVDGIEILSKVRILELRNENGIQVCFDQAGTRHELVCSHLLIATGRKPNTEDLNLSVTGVEVDKSGYVVTNEFLETSQKGIYALGDVKGGPAFTHVSYNDYIVAYRNIFSESRMSTRNRILPYCIFISPEFGRIGVSEKEVKAAGQVVLVTKLPVSHIARATEKGEQTGFLKAIVDPQSRKILGAAIIAPNGGELMSVLQIAMLGGVTCDQLFENVFAHPTYSESLNNLFKPISKLLV